MAASFWGLSHLLALLLPMAADPPNEPLSPSNVDVTEVFGDRLSMFLGYIQVGALTVVLVSVTGVGVIVAWSWVTGKTMPALGKFGAVIGGAIIIAVGPEAIDAFN